MSMIETPLMRGLARVLDESAFRHQLIAANLANIDTPGYPLRSHSISRSACRSRRRSAS